MEARISLPISLSLALLLAACGSSQSADVPEETANDAGVVDSGKRDSGTTRDSGGSTAVDSGGSTGGNVCAPSCTRDADCSSTCPSSAVYCCDFPTGTCYASQTSTCTHTSTGGDPDAGGLPYP